MTRITLDRERSVKGNAVRTKIKQEVVMRRNVNGEQEREEKKEQQGDPKQENASARQTADAEQRGACPAAHELSA
jgi:hypothetical protein